MAGTFERARRTPSEVRAGRRRRRPLGFTDAADRISRTGGTPLAVADGAKLLGIVHLKDIVKGGMKERIAQLRAMGIRSVMVTGDNPLTAGGDR